MKEALKVDSMTGTDFWKKAIDKEMRNVKPAFEFRDDNKVPIQYKHIDCHMIFDGKLDLTRKAQFVAGGHQTIPQRIWFTPVSCPVTVYALLFYWLHSTTSRYSVLTFRTPISTHLPRKRCTQQLARSLVRTRLDDPSLSSELCTD